jgi:hypothetical protein
MKEYPTQLKIQYPTSDKFPKDVTVFRTYLSTLLDTDKIYSSAIDVPIVKLLLKKCNIDLYIFNKTTTLEQNIKQVEEGSTLKNSIIIEYNGKNHYNFYSFTNSPTKLNILEDNTIAIINISLDAKGGFRKTQKKNKKKRNTRKK